MISGFNHLKVELQAKGEIIGEEFLLPNINYHELESNKKPILLEALIHVQDDTAIITDTLYFNEVYGTRGFMGSPNILLKFSIIALGLQPDNTPVLIFQKIQL